MVTLFDLSGSQIFGTKVNPIGFIMDMLQKIATKIGKWNYMEDGLFNCSGITDALDKYNNDFHEKIQSISDEWMKLISYEINISKLQSAIYLATMAMVVTFFVFLYQLWKHKTFRRNLDQRELQLRCEPEGEETSSRL